jgi:phthiocerol/phenolphthiocerol synthesis type-I polyketide synthase E
VGADRDAAVSNALTGFEIAIVGMSGRFPGAHNLETFWQNVREGVESIARFSDAELLAAGVPATALNDPRYVRAWGVLEGAALFDASFFGFAPRDAEITDPQHRLFLECAWQALEAAGYGAADYRGCVAVYAGTSLNTYLLHNLLPADSDLMRSDVGLSMIIGNDKDYLSTRVSYKLGLTGPSITLQTACSTSLVAVHLACQSLLAGECDMALAGGVTIRVPQTAGYWHRDGGMFSASGSCRPFDAECDGTVWGSGVGVVVLKRLSDAIACADHIHAVIKGTAINNDGAGKIGYTAPSVDGQARAIGRALAMADVPAETIGYIEAHGTGTVLGDPIEVAGLTQAFRASTPEQGFCAIGSVKALIGHLGAAAGVAGLIKTVLALEHKELPPNIHFMRPNPKIDFANSPFYVLSARSEWQSEPGPRRAGVSSFGIGGTNAHAVLEESPAHASTGSSRSFKLLVLSAKTPTALECATTNLVEHLRRHPGLDLADVAHTLQVGRERFGHRRALVCTSPADAIAAWEARDCPRVLTASGAAHTPVLAFMFPGGGAQSVNMGRDLYLAEPTFREYLDRCLQCLEPHVGRDLRRLLYPVPEGTADASQALTRPSMALPALFAVEYALAQLWMSWGACPQAMIGHSLGEYVAACLAEVVSLEDALALVVLRGQLLEKLPSGAMLSVALSEDELAPLLDDTLSLAAINGPSLCVASGPIAAIEALERRLAHETVQCRRLALATAAHSGLVEPVLSEFAALVERLDLHAPRIPYVSNITGTWITPAEAASPDYWVRHLRQTVRFTAGLHTLLQEPHRALLEVGPGHSLSTFARHHRTTAAGHTVLPSFGHSRENEPELASLLTTLGRLWLAGARVDWSGFSAHELRRRVPLPTYPFERQPYWIDARSPLEGRPTSIGAPPAADPHPVLALHASAPRDGRVPMGVSDVAQRDHLERKLTEIWQRVLGMAHIDIDANFFELGGHSLLAAQLFAQCEKTFGRKFPLSTLIHAPTVAQLARLLRQDEAPPSSCLVALQPHGSRPPFFCMHAESGQVLIYRELAQLLGPDQPVYALQAQGLDGARPPHETIEDMATHYLNEIRAVQPEGPYFLGGFCLGAVISFEIAQQLHARGEKVALLAALDASGPRFEKSLWDYIWFAMQTLREHPLALARYWISTRLKPRPVVVPGVRASDFPNSPAWAAVIRAINQARHQYNPQLYTGEVTWFVNSERAPLGGPQWSEFANGVERWVFPGGHATMFQSPAINVLATQVKACLEKTQICQPLRVVERAESWTSGATKPPAMLRPTSRSSLAGTMSTATSPSPGASSSTGRPDDR